MAEFSDLLEAYREAVEALADNPRSKSQEYVERARAARTAVLSFVGNLQAQLQATSDAVPSSVVAGLRKELDDLELLFAAASQWWLSNKPPSYKSVAFYLNNPGSHFYREEEKRLATAVAHVFAKKNGGQ